MPPPVMWAIPVVNSGSHQLLNHVQVAAVGLHQRRAGLFLDGGHVLRGLVSGHLKQQLAGQRVAVGVQPGGGQSDQDVAGLDAAPVTILSRSTAPTMKPARSYSPSE
jgi:hypothetical protein